LTLELVLINMLQNKIKKLATKIHNDTIATRRHLHQHPELSYQEVETGKFVAERLKDYGIAHTHGEKNHRATCGYGCFADNRSQ